MPTEIMPFSQAKWPLLNANDLEELCLLAFVSIASCLVSIQFTMQFPNVMTSIAILG